MDSDEHKNHHTEKIEKALYRIVPQVKKSERLLENRIHKIRNACERAVRRKNKTHEEFTLFAEKLDDEFEELLKNLKER